MRLLRGERRAHSAASRLCGHRARCPTLLPIVASLAGEGLRADHMRWLPAPFARKTRNTIGNVKAWMCAGRALTAKPANEVVRRALDGPHPGRIAVGAQIAFDESRAAFGDDVTDSSFKTCMVDNVFDQRKARRGLFSNAAHDDQPCSGNFNRSANAIAPSMSETTAWP